MLTSCASSFQSLLLLANAAVMLERKRSHLILLILFVVVAVAQPQPLSVLLMQGLLSINASLLHQSLRGIAGEKHISAMIVIQNNRREII